MLNRCLYTLNRRLLRLILFIMGMVVSLYVMKVQYIGEVEAQSHSFSTLAVDRIVQLHERTRGKETRYPINRRLGEPHSRLDIFGKRKSLVPAGIRKSPARSLVATPLTLFALPVLETLVTVETERSLICTWWTGITIFALRSLCFLTKLSTNELPSHVTN